MRSMRADELMTRDPATVTATQQVSDAVEIMKSEDCGAVPVVDPSDGQTLVGIVTDRDIALRACSEGGSGPETPIVNVMTSDPQGVSPDDNLERVREVMESAGVRRVPVLDGGRLVGIIAMKDLADHAESRVVGQTEEEIAAKEANN